MMARRYSKVLVPWLASGLLALAPLFGCATAPTAEDEELNLKKAASHFNLAADHADNGRLELALRDLLVAASLDPGNPRIQHSLGMVYLQKGKVAEAEVHLLRALEIRPDYGQARFNLSARSISTRGATRTASSIRRSSTTTPPSPGPGGR